MFNLGKSRSCLLMIGKKHWAKYAGSSAASNNCSHNCPHYNTDQYYSQRQFTLSKQGAQETSITAQNTTHIIWANINLLLLYG